MKTVIEMAREVDPVTKIILDRKESQGMSHDVFMWFLERFAELVRADERERWIDVKNYLIAARDGSMSRNNSETLAGELLEQLERGQITPARAAQFRA